MIDQESLPDFLNEAGELVDVLQNGLLALENASDEERAELVQNLFRAAHSIKGAAGMVGLERTAELTHALEEVLDAIRSGRSAVNIDIVDALFAGADCLTTLVAAIANGEGEAVETEDVTSVLKAVLPRGEEESSFVSSTLPVSPDLRERMSEMEDLNLFVAEHSGRGVFEGRFTVGELATAGIVSRSTPARLESLGEVVALVRLDAPVLIDASTWDDSSALLGVILATDKDESTIRHATPWIHEWRALTGAAVGVEPAPEDAGPPTGTTAGEAIPAPAGDRNKYLDLFLEESAEEIEGIVKALLALEKAAGPEAVRDAFRYAHRLKGGAAAMGYRSLAELCHRMEDLLDAIRGDRIPAGPPVVSLLLESSDAIRGALDAIRAGGRETISLAPFETRFAAMLGGIGGDDNAGLKTGAPVCATAGHPNAAQGGTEAPPSVFAWDLTEFEEAGMTAAFEAGGTVREVLFRFDEDAMMRGARAELVLTNLEVIGEVLAVRPPRRTLVAADPATVGVLVATTAADEEIRRAANVDQVRAVEIRPFDRRTGAAAVAPEQPSCRGAGEEATARSGARRSAPARTPGVGTEAPPADRRLGASPPPGDAFVDAGRKPAAAAVKPGQSIRVDLEKLDALMNMAGELVVIRARFQRHAEFISQGLGVKEIVWSAEDLARRAEATCAPELVEALRNHLEKLRSLQNLRTASADLELTAQQLLRVSTALQNGVMSARMLPVAQVFNRFPRLVRDLSRQFGKEVRLEVRGEETELDKRVIDELGDPLTHLIRNSLDHGLEPPEEREAGGKPASALLELAAFREGSLVCIQIRDDGRGINRARVLAKARERGLIPAERTLTDEEILQLIFQPGFSTAATVSDVSGRGVGMDIVKSRIEELKGTIEIESIEGEGTTVTLRIPLTLSILKVLLVQDAGVTLAVPVEQITEITRLRADAVKTIEGRPVSQVRESVLPVLDLAASLGLTDGAEASRPFALVVRAHGGAVIFRVEQLLGEEEVVVKGLPDEMAHVEGLSGVTILGDGRVALIMDAAGQAMRLANAGRGGVA